MRRQMLPAPLWSERSTNSHEDGVQRSILARCFGPSTVTQCSAFDTGEKARREMVKTSHRGAVTNHAAALRCGCMDLEGQAGLGGSWGWRAGA